MYTCHSQSVCQRRLYCLLLRRYKSQDIALQGVRPSVHILTMMPWLFQSGGRPHEDGWAQARQRHGAGHIPQTAPRHCWPCPGILPMHNVVPAECTRVRVTMDCHSLSPVSLQSCWMTLLCHLYERGSLFRDTICVAHLCLVWQGLEGLLQQGGNSNGAQLQLESATSVDGVSAAVGRRGKTPFCSSPAAEWAQMARTSTA
jgi:hypothetical protein